MAILSKLDPQSFLAVAMLFGLASTAPLTGKPLNATMPFGNLTASLPKPVAHPDHGHPFFPYIPEAGGVYSNKSMNEVVHLLKAHLKTVDEERAGAFAGKKDKAPAGVKAHSELEAMSKETAKPSARPEGLAGFAAMIDDKFEAPAGFEAMIKDIANFPDEAHDQSKAIFEKIAIAEAEHKAGHRATLHNDTKAGKGRVAQGGKGAEKREEKEEDKAEVLADALDEDKKLQWLEVALQTLEHIKTAKETAHGEYLQDLEQIADSLEGQVGSYLGDDSEEEGEEEKLGR